MKTANSILFALASILLLQPLAALPATTLDHTNRYAYSANLAWIDGVADTNHGAVIGEYVCSGNLYSANAGWINLGNGTPTNGIYYQNLSSNDFGVNQDGLGNLRGYAYGANLGWVNFETNGAPKVNLLNGQLSGYIWSANCGWISLSNSVAYVQTDAIRKGALSTNGLPIAWLLANFGTTNINASADPTGKGNSIGQDYLAGTDPNNKNSILRITAESFAPGGTNANLTWNSEPTRYYKLQRTPTLSSNAWADSGLGFIAPSASATTSAGFSDTNAPIRFYRVEAVRPLTP